MPRDVYKALIERSLARGVDVPDNARSASQFSIKRDFDRYLSETNGAAISIDQWQLHFKKVMSSPKLIMKKKVDLLMRGGLPQKSAKGHHAHTTQLARLLSEKRVRFIGEVVRMVGVS